MFLQYSISIKFKKEQDQILLPKKFMEVLNMIGLYWWVPVL